MNDFESFSEFTVGSVLKQAWRIMWKKRGKFIVLTLLSVVIATVAAALLFQLNLAIGEAFSIPPSFEGDRADSGGLVLIDPGRDYIGLALVSGFLMAASTPFIVFTIIQGMITNDVFQLFTSGRASKPKPSEHPQPSSLRIFFASLVLGLTFAFACVVLPFLLVWGLIIFVPVCAAENLKMIECLRRSFALTRGYRAKITGICILFYVVMAIVTIIIAIAAIIIVTPGIRDSVSWIMTEYMPEHLLAAVMILPLTYINVLPAVIYCSLRAVKE